MFSAYFDVLLISFVGIHSALVSFKFVHRRQLHRGSREVSFCPSILLRLQFVDQFFPTVKW